MNLIGCTVPSQRMGTATADTGIRIMKVAHSAVEALVKGKGRKLRGESEMIPRLPVAASAQWALARDVARGIARALAREFALGLTERQFHSPLDRNSFRLPLRERKAAH